MHMLSRYDAGLCFEILIIPFLHAPPRQDLPVQLRQTLTSSPPPLNRYFPCQDEPISLIWPFIFSQTPPQSIKPKKAIEVRPKNATNKKPNNSFISLISCTVLSCMYLLYIDVHMCWRREREREDYVISRQIKLMINGIK